VTLVADRPDMQAAAPAPATRSTVHPALLVAIVVAGSLAALNAGYQAVSGGSIYVAALPVGALVGIGMAWLALVNFEAFVLSLLVARAVLDFSRGKVERSVGAATSSGPWAAAASGFLVVAGLLWLASPQQRRRFRERSWAEIAMGVFVLTAAVSIVQSAHPERSALELARISAAVIMFAILRRVVRGNPHMADRVLTAVFASAIVPLVVAAFQILAGSGGFHAGGYSRVRGTFVHPNPFAFYLTMLIVMGVALYPHLRGWRQATLALVLAGGGVALMATYTRTGWLALFVALLVVGFLQSRWLIPVLLVGALLVVALVPSVGGRFSDLGQTRRASGAAGNSLIWRTDYWRQAIDLADRSPIIGIGLKMTQASTEEQKAPHNDFIRAYAETGVIGLAAYLAIIAGLIGIARRALLVGRRGRERGIAVGFTACLVAFLLFSVVSNVASQVVLLWYFFAFAAVATSVGSTQLERAADANPPRQ
jgi:O-antigen ligase